MNSQSKTTIRLASEDDVQKVDVMFQKQGWGSRLEVLRKYVKEQEEGERFFLLAERERQIVGYITLMKIANHGPFATQYPKVSDFNVFDGYQRLGVGNQLMEAAEQKAKDFSPIVTIGVGLHEGYGTAQRMYVKRGYIPDGSGMWYENNQLEANAPCFNDDELVLYFSKRLSSK